MCVQCKQYRDCQHGKQYEGEEYCQNCQHGKMKSTVSVVSSTKMKSTVSSAWRIEYYSDEEAMV